MTPPAPEPAPAPETNGATSDGADTAEATAWLSPDEEQAWIGMFSILLLVPGPLDARMRRSAGISLYEYLVLSALSMSEQHQLRMSEVANLAPGSLSRLSNVVKGMEARGLVRREPDPDDGRSTVAILTEAGFALVVRAAPDHVAAVREHVLDPLTTSQQRALQDIGERLTSCSTARRPH